MPSQIPSLCLIYFSGTEEDIIKDIHVIHCFLPMGAFLTFPKKRQGWGTYAGWQEILHMAKITHVIAISYQIIKMDYMCLLHAYPSHFGGRELCINASSKYLIGVTIVAVWGVMKVIVGSLSLLYPFFVSVRAFGASSKQSFASMSWFHLTFWLLHTEATLMQWSWQLQTVLDIHCHLANALPVFPSDATFLKEPGLNTIFKNSRRLFGTWNKEIPGLKNTSLS